MATDRSWIFARAAGRGGVGLVKLEARGLGVAYLGFLGGLLLPPPTLPPLGCCIDLSLHHSWDRGSTPHPPALQKPPKGLAFLAAAPEGMDPRGSSFSQSPSDGHFVPHFVWYLYGLRGNGTIDCGAWAAACHTAAPWRWRPR